VKDSMKKTPFDTNQEPISNRLITGLAKISLALKTQAWKGANERGLSPTQAQILALLARDANRGQRLNDLAEALAVTAATTSDAVRSLEQKGSSPLNHPDRCRSRRSSPQRRMARRSARVRLRPLKRRTGRVLACACKDAREFARTRTDSSLEHVHHLPVLSTERAQQPKQTAPLRFCECCFW
jgi:DNA-binding MarR family transcriptional regulator